MAYSALNPSGNTVNAWGVPISPASTTTSQISSTFSGNPRDLMTTGHSPTNIALGKRTPAGSSNSASSGGGGAAPVDYTNFITNNYQDLFGRNPDQEGLDYWNDELNNGMKTGGFSQTLINGAAPEDYAYYKNRDQTKIFNEDISGKKVGSYSGLGDHGKRLLDELIPKLINSVEGWRSDIDDSTRAAADLYGSMSKEAMREKAQSILDDLASRGIFSGSVVSDAMGKGMAEIAKGTADSGMEAAMVGASMKAQEPAMLGNIVGLGKSSESFNELGPYELLLSQMG